MMLRVVLGLVVAGVVYYLVGHFYTAADPLLIAGAAGLVYIVADLMMSPRTPARPGPARRGDRE